MGWLNAGKSLHYRPQHSVTAPPLSPQCAADKRLSCLLRIDELPPPSTCRSRVAIALETNQVIISGISWNKGMIRLLIRPSFFADGSDTTHHNNVEVARTSDWRERRQQEARRAADVSAAQ